MGCCASTPAADTDPFCNKGGGAGVGAGGIPNVDFGTLTELYRPGRLLGSGACGDTYLMVRPVRGSSGFLHFISQRARGYLPDNPNNSSQTMDSPGNSASVRRRRRRPGARWP